MTNRRVSKQGMHATLPLAPGFQNSVMALVRNSKGTFSLK